MAPRLVYLSALVLLSGCASDFDRAWDRASRVHNAGRPMAGAWEDTSGWPVESLRVILDDSDSWPEFCGLQLAPNDYVLHASGAVYIFGFPYFRIDDDFIFIRSREAAGITYYHGIGNGPSTVAEFRYHVEGSCGGSVLTLACRRLDRPRSAPPDRVFRLKRVVGSSRPLP